MQRDREKERGREKAYTNCTDAFALRCIKGEYLVTSPARGKEWVTSAVSSVTQLLHPSWSSVTTFNKQLMCEVKPLSWHLLAGDVALSSHISLLGSQAPLGQCGLSRYSLISVDGCVSFHPLYRPARILTYASFLLSPFPPSLPPSQDSKQTKVETGAGVLVTSCPLFRCFSLFQLRVSLFFILSSRSFYQLRVTLLRFSCSFLHLHSNHSTPSHSSRHLPLRVYSLFLLG